MLKQSHWVFFWILFCALLPSPLVVLFRVSKLKSRAPNLNYLHTERLFLSQIFWDFHAILNVRNDSVIIIITLMMVLLFIALAEQRKGSDASLLWIWSIPTYDPAIAKYRPKIILEWLVCGDNMKIKQLNHIQARCDKNRNGIDTKTSAYVKHFW